MNFFTLRTPVLRPKEDLISFFCSALTENKVVLNERSVVIIASKIVAVSQGRIAAVKGKEKILLIQQEADTAWASENPEYFLTIKNGILVANAGIDASNAGLGKVILWPQDSQKVAGEFRATLQKKFGLQQIGVLIMDSVCTPLRAGISGVALGWSGFHAVRNERGKKDLFGRALEVTQVAVADNLASAAQLLIGSSNESTPFVICEHAPVEFTDLNEEATTTLIPPEQDLFRIFWQK